MARKRSRIGKQRLRSDMSVVNPGEVGYDNASQQAEVIEMTICSTMFCYNDAEFTNDPANPPFCEQCKGKWERENA